MPLIAVSSRSFGGEILDELLDVVCAYVTQPERAEHRDQHFTDDLFVECVCDRGEPRLLYFEVFRGELSEAHTVGASLNAELGDLILELLYEGVEFSVELLVCQFRLGRFEDTGFGDRLSGGVGAAGNSDEVGSVRFWCDTCQFMTIPFVQTCSFEAVLKDGLSGFQNSRPNVVKASKLLGLKIHFQTCSFSHSES